MSKQLLIKTVELPNQCSTFPQAWDGRHVIPEGVCIENDGGHQHSLGKIRNTKVSSKGVVEAELHLDPQSLSPKQIEAIKQGHFEAKPYGYGPESIPSHIEITFNERKGHSMTSLKEAFDKVFTNNNKSPEPMQRQDLTEIFKANHTKQQQNEDTPPTSNEEQSEGLQRRSLQAIFASKREE